MLHENCPTSFSVLFLIDQVWGGRGGSEQHLNWLLERLPNEVIRKRFVIFSRIIGNTEVFPVQPKILGDVYGKGKLTFLRRFFALVRYIKEEQIDIVHAFSPMDEMVGVVACWWAGVGRVCAHRRNIGYGLNFQNRWMSLVIQQFKIPYIANSEAARQAAFQNERININRITVIRNPVFIERKQAGFEKQIHRTDIPVPLGNPFIGMVASVRTIKGYEVFIQAAQYVLQKWPNAYFICIGEQDPIYLKRLKALSCKLQIEDRLIWYGFIDNAFKILPHLTVAILSSHSESFSNAVLEYAVAERAIVATDVGGMREIITDGETGFLVPPNQPDLLADRIVALLDDPQKRKSFGTKAKEFVVHHFSEEIILKQYLSFYQNILRK